MNCPACGAAAAPGAKFCENCGAKLPVAPAPADMGFYGYGDGGYRLAPGYSRRLDAPEVQAALQKQSKAVRISALILTALPLMGFLIYGAVSDSMSMGQAFFFGVVIALIFGLTSIITILKQKLSRPFQGTVSDKKHFRRVRARRRNYSARHVYRLYIDCEDGKRRKKDVHKSVFDYLQIGDRVRCLPQFPQPFEKYDKSADPAIPCMFCGAMNPPENDRCATCKNPMIK